MSDPEELRRQEEMRDKMAAIGARYLARTKGELDDLRRLVAKLDGDVVTALREIEVLAHRIRGSGAVFGYGKLSDAAGAIEMLAVDSATQTSLDKEQLAARFVDYIAILGDELTIAAQPPSLP